MPIFSEFLSGSLSGSSLNGRGAILVGARPFGKYTFLPWTHHAPSSSGVYIFTDIFGTPAYIGETENIKERVGNHEYYNRPTESRAPAIGVPRNPFYYICDEYSRKQIEKELIQKYNPRYNKEYNPLHSLTGGLDIVDRIRGIK